MFTESGGIEVARTPERLEELNRRIASAKSWGIEPVQLLTPAEVKKLVPFVDDRSSSAASTRRASASSTRCARARSCASRHRRTGALTVSPTPRSPGSTSSAAAIAARADPPRRRRDRGRRDRLRRLEPRIAAMAGASIPLTPAVHQMIDVGPVPLFADASARSSSRSSATWTRTCTSGSTAASSRSARTRTARSCMIRTTSPRSRRPRCRRPSCRSPQEDFDAPDGARARADARDRRRRVASAIKYAINGLLSLTPDGLPLLGETPEVQGLWSAAAIWVKEGPGRRQDGRRVDDRTAARRSTRTPPTSPASTSTRRRGARPRADRGGLQQDLRHRPSRPSSGTRTATSALSPFHERERALGAVFFEAAGWERPHWYESNAALLEEYGDRVTRREAEWDVALVVADHQRRAPGHARPRRHRGPRPRSHLRRRRARARSSACSAWPCARWTSPIGRVVYTPLLTPGGGFQVDLTIMRLGDERVPGRHRRRARRWPTASGSPTTCRTTARAQLARPDLGVEHARPVGPARARRPRRRHERRRLARGLPVRDAAGGSRSAPCTCSPRGSPTSASSAGSCTCRSSRAPGCGTRSGRRGSRTASSPSGSASTAPPGGSRRATARYGTELELEYDLVEAGMAWGNGQGRGLHRQRGPPPPARARSRRRSSARSPSTTTRRRPASGATCSGREPILTRDGEPLVDAKGRRSFVTSAGAGPVGRASTS